jgi:hypothetical protein
LGVLLHTNTEVPLATYSQLHTPRAEDEGLCRRVLGGQSCRDYEAALEAFGLTKSSVSRLFVRAGAKVLQTLHERRHHDEEWLVLLLGGKSFADDQIVIALVVNTTGEKHIMASCKPSPRISGCAPPSCPSWSSTASARPPGYRWC